MVFRHVKRRRNLAKILRHFGIARQNRPQLKVSERGGISAAAAAWFDPATLGSHNPRGLDPSV